MSPVPARAGVLGSCGDGQSPQTLWIRGCNLDLPRELVGPLVLGRRHVADRLECFRIEIQPEHLPFIGASEEAVQESILSVGQVIHEEPYHTARRQVLAEFERRYLTVLLNRAGGNMSKAARMAGVDRTTLYRLMEKQRRERETTTVGTDDA